MCRSYLWRIQTPREPSHLSWSSDGTLVRHMTNKIFFLFCLCWNQSLSNERSRWKSTDWCENQREWNQSNRFNVLNLSNSFVVNSWRIDSCWEQDVFMFFVYGVLYAIRSFWNEYQRWVHFEGVMTWPTDVNFSCIFRLILSATFTWVYFWKFHKIQQLSLPDCDQNSRSPMSISSVGPHLLRQ